MLTVLEGWWDQWIAENYPDSVVYTDTSGEIYIGLGEGVNGEKIT